MKAIREAEWADEPAPVVKASPHPLFGRALDARRLRLVFAGTPDAGAPVARGAAGQPARRRRRRHPPRRAGRPRPHAAARARWRAAPRRARSRGARPRARREDPDFQERLRALAPDCCPVVAYGALVPRPRSTSRGSGWVNLHFSLLPAWRGAAPVQHAVLAGDEVTGATTFLLEEGLDTGPVLGVLTETVRPTDTAGDLLERLADAGAGLLVATLDGARGRRPSRRAAAGRGRLARPEAHRRRRPRRLDGTGAARRPADPRLHPGARRLDDLARPPAQARPGDASPTTRPGARRASTGDLVGTATHRRAARRGAAARASARWRPPTGRAGLRLEPRRVLRVTPDAAEAGRRRPVPAAPPPAPTRPGWPPTTCSRRSASETRTPTWSCRPAARAPAGPPRRRVRDRARLRHAARAGPLDAVLAGLRRPAAGRGRPAGARRAPARRVPAARTRVPAMPPSRATVDLARAVLSRRAGRLRQRGAAQGRRAATATAGWPQLAPPTTRPAPGARAPATRAGSRRPSATRSAGRGRDRGRRSRADDERPEVHLAARRIDRERAGRRRAAAPRAVVAVRGPPRRGDPGGLEPVRDGRAGVQDEGSQLVALALAGAPLDGPDAPLARPVRRPRRQGRAAGRPRRRARRPAASRVELQPHRARLVRAASGVARRRHRRRPRGRRWPTARPTGSCSTRPAPGLGALRRRPEARWRRQPADLPGLTPLQRELLDAAVRPAAPGRSPRLRHLLAAPGRDARAGRRPAAPPPRRRAARRPAAVPRRARPRRRTGTCSCGRTGTAPTRCTSPCCRKRDA